MCSEAISRRGRWPGMLAGLGLIGLLLAGSAAANRFDVDAYRPLTADRRALRVGETLTVIVLESTRASSRAATDSASDTQISIEAHDRRHPYSAGARMGGENSGTGGTTRSGDVRAQLAVRVVESQPGGMLKVEGEQVLIVNGEAQTIRLSGVVRTDDIGPDNTVLSNRIGDARIEFSGRGVVSDAQRQTLMYRILRWLRLI